VAGKVDQEGPRHRRLFPIQLRCAPFQRGKNVRPFHYVALLPPVNTSETPRKQDHSPGQLEVARRSGPRIEPQSVWIVRIRPQLAAERDVLQFRRPLKKVTRVSVRNEINDDRFCSQTFQRVERFDGFRVGPDVFAGEPQQQHFGFGLPPVSGPRVKPVVEHAVPRSQPSSLMKNPDRQRHGNSNY
jgi:hypothetical protein